MHDRSFTGVQNSAELAPAGTDIAGATCKLHRPPQTKCLQPKQQVTDNAAHSQDSCPQPLQETSNTL